MNYLQTLLPATIWFTQQGWTPFPFQEQTWQTYLDGKSGLLNAPTGSGKTYALWLPILLNLFKDGNQPKGLNVLWITPIRALTKEIKQATERASEGIGLPVRVGIRTGDTPTPERTRQKSNPPNLLITTPESLHLLLAQKNYPDFFKNLQAIVVDEWHELLGSKRGVQMELALSRLKTLLPDLRIWGISATIGNLDEALEILLGNDRDKRPRTVIRTSMQKEIEVKTILPDAVDELPWAGHLGIKLLEKVLPIIHASQSTLIFTNTRAMAEIWYQRLLDVEPDLAGVMAMHHGSISREIRDWVEDGLHEGRLKAVVCTSSLDLGVDFRPVESVVQIGSPKGVARFMQRAGRSGHQPGAVSRIYFVPTHALELVEAAALRKAIREQYIEDRIPYIRSFDVLAQYLVTLAVSDGFRPAEIWPEIKSTFAYTGLEEDEWQWLLNFITTGGDSLYAYDEYKKVDVIDGVFRVTSRRIAMQHRLSIGTIVSDIMMRVKFVHGKYIGSIEEWFISKMIPGDVFWFGGQALELFKVQGLTVLVKKTNKRSGRIPSWQGGRMPLSAKVADMLRQKLTEAADGTSDEEELVRLQPLLDIQQTRSHLPRENEFLIEKLETSEGYHVFLFPFEGRFVHEGMSILLAYRLSLLEPFSFSLAYNDYGLELLSDKDIPVEAIVDNNLLTPEHLYEDIQASLNATEMARRRFRDIAQIAGLVFPGYPGRMKQTKHLQSSSQLLFEVFQDYDPDNLLMKQSYQEAMDFQLEEARLRKALQRIQQQKIIITYPEKPTPLCFPILVDRLRERYTNEELQDRISRMQVEYRE